MSEPARRRYERRAPIVRQMPGTAALENAICDSLADAPASVYELADDLSVSVDRVERAVKALQWSGLVEVGWLAMPASGVGRPLRVLVLARTKPSTFGNRGDCTPTGPSVGSGLKRESPSRGSQGTVRLSDPRAGSKKSRSRDAILPAPGDSSKIQFNRPDSARQKSSLLRGCTELETCRVSDGALNTRKVQSLRVGGLVEAPSPRGASASLAWSNG